MKHIMYTIGWKEAEWEQGKLEADNRDMVLTKTDTGSGGRCRID
jgi:hypothetical protein